MTSCLGKISALRWRNLEILKRKEGKEGKYMLSDLNRRGGGPPRGIVAMENDGSNLHSAPGEWGCLGNIPKWQKGRTHGHKKKNPRSIWES